MEKDIARTQGTAGPADWFEDLRLAGHSVRMPLLYDWVIRLEPGDLALRYMLAAGRDKVIFGIAHKPLMVSCRARRLSSQDTMLSQRAGPETPALHP